ncbi:hypothetical protein HW555_000159 [Spodoptera exigua]|uniref:Endonuclease/exonuclease/phosphatase domain-containing protein n=1 Tax=Spodoptera exigua TaxID=7107 RepID=A0A835GWR6_SPOEX|nr:hypothetical protein HW555_000159 [Spodoptera exigua]
MTGDFNLPNVEWSLSGMGIRWILYNSHKNTNDRILDLVLSNNYLDVAKCSEPLVSEDPHHVSLCINFDFVEYHNMLPTQPRLKFLFDLANYEIISKELDTFDWNNDLVKGTVEDATSLFYSRLDKLCSLHVPVKMIKPSSKYPIWYKSPLIKILKEKFKHHRKFKKYGNRCDYDSFSALRDRGKILEREMFADYIDTIESNIKKSPKSFWSFVKTKQGSNAYPSTMSYGQCASSDTEEKTASFAVNTEYYEEAILLYHEENSLISENQPLLSQIVEYT